MGCGVLALTPPGDDPAVAIAASRADAWGMLDAAGRVMDDGFPDALARLVRYGRGAVGVRCRPEEIEELAALLGSTAGSPRGRRGHRCGRCGRRAAARPRGHGARRGDLDVVRHERGRRRGRRPGRARQRVRGLGGGGVDVRAAPAPARRRRRGSALGVRRDRASLGGRVRRGRGDRRRARRTAVAGPRGGSPTGGAGPGRGDGRQRDRVSGCRPGSPAPRPRRPRRRRRRSAAIARGGPADHAGQGCGYRDLGGRSRGAGARSPRRRTASCRSGRTRAFAASLAEQWVTVGGIVQAVRNAVEDHLAAARRTRPLAAGSALARRHGTRYPVVQGPMTRVSDRAAFSASVADAGGLPLLALALMRRAEVAPLLLRDA